MPRGARIKTSLGEDALLFERMTGRESLGDVFEYTVSLLSKDHGIDLSAILGENVTIEVDTPESITRYFNGHVVSFSMAGSTLHHARYQVVVRPWLWLLSLGSTSRIFQNKTVPEIVKEIFRARGFTDFREALHEQYRTWEYSVQYRETDLNYISRLMEQEGIYYYFEHGDGKHTLVLADSPNSHAPTAGYEEVHYFASEDQVAQEADRIHSWRAARQMRPGVFSSGDYDFTRPKASLAARLKRPLNQLHADFEVYDHPGEYLELAAGENHVRVRLDQQQGDFEIAEASGNVRGLTPGALFTLHGHPREDQNREYLLVSATYEVSSHAYESGGADREDFGGTYTCISSRQPYRTAPHSPKPKVDGPQTATVVGKAGEEIWTDQYGRVKVQFHWDREGARDETSSCWVRVAQVWAGAKWGAMHIPRMGQEVIVDFLEGDPDRPIITGRVYNGDNMPPYTLPDNKTQSGIKSRSTLGGGPNNFNEIRFEDKKGSEQLYIQAEKNQDNLVKADDSLSVGGSRTKSIGVDETVTVGSNRTETVGADEKETIGANQTVVVGANQSTTVGANQTLSVAANRSVSVGASQTETISVAFAETVGAAKALSIGAAYQVSVGAAMNETVGGLKAEEIGGAKSVNVGGFSSENVGANKSVSAGGNISESAGGNVALTAGKDVSASAGADFLAKAAKKGLIDAGDELTLKCGGASIVLKKNGDIIIKGKKIQVDGSGDVIVKGSKIGLN